MKGRVATGAAIAIAALVAFFSWRSGPHLAASDATRPKLFLIVRTNGHIDTNADASIPKTGAGPLAVATMGDRESARVTKELTRMTEHAEIAANPFVVDLEDEDAKKDTQMLSRDLLPRLTAARALTAGHWRAEDGLDVRVATSCEAVTSDGARCIEAAGGGTKSDDRLVARARFLAWPVTRALHLRAEKGEAHRVALRLRELSEANPETTIALIVDEAALAPSAVDAGRSVEGGDGGEAGATDVRSAAATLLETSRRALKSEARATLHDFAQAPTGERLVPWLALGDDLLLIPKLSADDAAARAEAERWVASAGLPGLRLVERASR